MEMAFDSAPFNEDTFMQERFLELKEQFGIKNVIETGTYHGITTRWLSENFERVWTTEINESFYKIAKDWLIDCNNVNMTLGDSTLCLSYIIRELDKSPCLFFLDAHWYTNPLIGELMAIKESGIKPDVIVIHDFYNPNDPSMGYDVYPEQSISYVFDWVKPRFDDIYGENGYTFDYNKQATGARRGALFVFKKECV